MDQLYQQLKEFGRIKINEPLSKHTTFKIGGPADFFVTVDDTDKLVRLLKFLDGEGVSYFILGGGSNMLASDEGFRGVVVKIQDTHNKIQNETIEAGAGMPTVALAQATIQGGLTGFEWGVGVPGTIGGAVRGNAGAMGGEMKDVVEKVEVYKDGEVVIWSNEELQFGYRHSRLKDEGGVVLRVWLKLEKSDNKEGMRKTLEYLQYRNKTQPQGYASTGCIFKNYQIPRDKIQTISKLQIPKEFLERGLISAGWLVEQVGMKGERVGNAMVSERHGNFVVNMGGATAADVLTLVEKIQAAVYDTYGIELKEEIQIL